MEKGGGSMIVSVHDHHREGKGDEYAQSSQAGAMVRKDPGCLTYVCIA